MRSCPESRSGAGTWPGDGNSSTGARSPPGPISSGAAAPAIGLRGARRRFTGSYEVGSFAGPAGPPFDERQAIWDSAEACGRYRGSDIEAGRREAMGPFVLEERSSFYTGRQLGIGGR
jgi:hypothetical protein